MQLRTDLLEYSDSSEGENNALIFSDDEIEQIGNEKKTKKKNKDMAMSVLNKIGFLKTEKLEVNVNVNDTNTNSRDNNK
jgi:hypothetical protein